jgi:hypothetical protein
MLGLFETDCVLFEVYLLAEAGETVFVAEIECVL